MNVLCRTAQCGLAPSSHAQCALTNSVRSLTGLRPSPPSAVRARKLRFLAHGLAPYIIFQISGDARASTASLATGRSARSETCVSSLTGLRPMASASGLDAYVQARRLHDRCHLPHCLMLSCILYHIHVFVSITEKNANSACKMRAFLISYICYGFPDQGAKLCIRRCKPWRNVQFARKLLTLATR